MLLSGVSVLSVDLFSFFFHSCLGSEQLSICSLVLKSGTQQLCEMQHCNSMTSRLNSVITLSLAVFSVSWSVHIALILWDIFSDD